MDSVTHHGRATAYRQHDRGGDDDPVLFVHGSGGSHTVWTGQASLADERPVVALDLSGHGESDDVDASAGFETLSAYVDDVVAVARATDTRVLCGASIGGAVVLRLILEREFDPTGIVLTGIGARLAVLDDVLRWLRTDFERAIAFLHGPNRFFHEPTDRLTTTSQEMLSRTGQAVTRRDFRTCHTFDVRGRLDGVGVPSLAVTGEHDALTPPWYHESLATVIPKATWETIPDAAHLPMLERPEAFNETVTAFIDGRIATH